MKKPLFNSFLTHVGGVLLLGLGYGYLATHGPAPEPPIEVRLEDVHIHHSATVKPTERDPVPAPVKLAPDRSAPSSVPLAEEKETQGKADAAATPDTVWNRMTGDQRSAYLSQLMRIIASQKSYPRAAILNEQQGVVKLRVTLGDEGGVTACEVVESSGHEILDQAAVATLRKIGKFPLPTPDARGVVLVIPIRYEINPSH